MKCYYRTYDKDWGHCYAHCSFFRLMWLIIIRKAKKWRVEHDN